MEILGAAEVFDFAIRIEEIGELFYRKALLYFSDEESVSILERLADEEIRHRDVFKEMKKKTQYVSYPESYPGEYMKYLRGFIDKKVIFKDEPEKTELVMSKDPSSILDFAIQRELDSILFYHELKSFLPESQKNVIDQLISEERSHFQTLSRLKQKYS